MYNVATNNIQTKILISVFILTKHLGKIFMAIDNLFYRSNENSYRLKYEFDEKGSI